MVASRHHVRKRKQRRHERIVLAAWQHDGGALRVGYAHGREPVGPHTHAIVATNTVYCDRDRPSHVTLPIIPTS